MKKKFNIKNLIAYVQGNIRYCLYYSDFNYLIPLHIREQIEGRIESMKKECYNNGSCTECGCRTTHLQMANKSCDGNCYPKMVNKEKWKYMKKGVMTLINGELWVFKRGKFKKRV